MTRYFIIVASIFYTHLLLGQVFEERSAEVGLNFTHDIGDIEDSEWGIGAVWLDYNQDGYLDLFVTTRVGPNQFYENIDDGNGSRTFQNITSFLDSYGDCNGCVSTSIAQDCTGASAADFNNDGFPDIYLMTAKEDIFLMNIGGDHFADRTAEVLGTGVNHVAGLAKGNSVSWGDFDNDGYLDLYLAAHTPADYEDDETQRDTNDYLLHNNGGINFEDASFLISQYDVLWGSSFIGGWTDFDLDGDLDLFVTNDCTDSWPIQNVFYENIGGSRWNTWKFDTVQSVLGIKECAHPMGLAVGDINRDRRMDFLTSNIGDVRLWQNTESGFFNIATSAGMAVQDPDHFSWGVNLGDFDLDGWLDAVVTSGYWRLGGPWQSDAEQPNYYFHNNGTNGHSFTDRSASSSYNSVARGRTSIMGDYDNDGDLDIFVNNYDAPCEFEENTLNVNDRDWIKIDLEGVISNRDGIGTKVALHYTDNNGISQVQYAETRSGSSLGGGDSPYLLFGMGEDATIDSILLDWPSGIHQSIPVPPVDTFMTIIEGQILPHHPRGIQVFRMTCENCTQLSLAAEFYPETVADTIELYYSSADLISFDLIHKESFGNQENWVFSASRPPNAGLYKLRLTQAGRTVDTHTMYYQPSEHYANRVLWPNPARDELTLSPSIISSSADIYLFDASGKEHLLKQKMENQVLDISHLSNGMYFLLVQGEMGVKAFRFIVRK